MELNVILALQLCPRPLQGCLGPPLSGIGVAVLPGCSHSSFMERSSDNWLHASVHSQKGPFQFGLSPPFLLRTLQNAYHTLDTHGVCLGRVLPFQQDEFSKIHLTEFFLPTRLNTLCSQCHSTADGQAVSQLQKVNQLPPLSQWENVTMQLTGKSDVGWPTNMS